MNKIGIIGAMEVEVETLIAQMENIQKTEKARMIFCEGTLAGQNVVVVRSGIGKVNAAVCTQILADDFHVTHIINSGAAGSLDAKINIGDFVISTDVVHHDVDGTGFGYAKGEVPQLGITFFPADEEMMNRAETACKKAAPDVNTFRGRICSGDQFIADDGVKKGIIETFHGLCCEMEGAAIAHTCYLNHIPFVIIRAISDKADGSSEVDYPTFEKKAAHDAAATVMEFLKN
ncbi:MAG: 5'-methylthioadenosine/adenosylhomocysteine nucleosidase [Lachnospiraceae bacterium]|nr:5'-methylthioadenosine/adenosylhomocysteine nucleosidase [Lachnospiraceae bacterium]